MSLIAAILLASTSLHVTVWPDGMGQPGKKEYTLRCAPAAGTLPRRGAACTQLMRLNRPFAATPKNVACSEIYGGPQVALVTGRFRGNLVRARFSRTDGCEIGRWSRVRFLFPGVATANSR